HERPSCMGVGKIVWLEPAGRLPLRVEPTPPPRAWTEHRCRRGTATAIPVGGGLPHDPPVEAPVLNRLTHMLRFERSGLVEVGDGARDLENAVIRARR